MGQKHLLHYLYILFHFSQSFKGYTSAKNIQSTANSHIQSALTCFSKLFNICHRTHTACIGHRMGCILSQKLCKLCFHTSGLSFHIHCMDQKFVALFFCDYQQWFEYNRTGYPELPIGEGILNANNKMPKRFKYPASLQRTNLKNYQAAKANMGGDDFDIRLMWQK